MLRNFKSSVMQSFQQGKQEHDKKENLYWSMLHNIRQHNLHQVFADESQRYLLVTLEKLHCGVAVAQEV